MAFDFDHGAEYLRALVKTALIFHEIGHLSSLPAPMISIPQTILSITSKRTKTFYAIITFHANKSSSHSL